MTLTAPLPENEHVFDFVRAKGERLLSVLAERPRPDAIWQVHSHGAWIAVEGERPELFERQVIVVVRCPDRPTNDFAAWATERLERLGRFLEVTNTGRVVRALPLEGSVAGVLMRRRGDDLLACADGLPDPRELPAILARLASDIDRYIHFMGDGHLRYVDALRLHTIPCRGGPPRHRIGLGVSSTAIGVQVAPVDLTAISLLRGVLGELANLLEGDADRRGRRRRLALAAHLRDLVEQIDDPPGLSLSSLRQRLERPPRRTRPVTVSAGLLAAAGLAAWLLL